MVMMMMMMMMTNRNHNPNPNSYSNICDDGLFRLRGVAGLQISTSFSLYSGMNSKLSLHTTRTLLLNVLFGSITSSTP